VAIEKDRSPDNDESNSKHDEGRAISFQPAHSYISPDLN
jgi:hypothetical protein